MPKTKVTEESVAEMRAMREGGMTYRAIAREFGVVKTTVRRRLNPEVREEDRAKNRQHSRDHRTARKEYSKRYYAETRDARLSYNREWRAAHPDYYARYCEEHGEKERARKRHYFKEHREEDRARSKKYRQEHPEKILAKSARGRARKRDATPDLTPEQKESIARIYNTAINGARVRCYLCGEIMPKGDRHVDHIMPISKGGLHIPSNLAVACATCNLSKHAKLPEEIGLLC